MECQHWRVALEEGGKNQRTEGYGQEDEVRVRSYGLIHERRIAVSFGSGEHGLDIAEATELRDALTREIGQPSALTDREAMVWAAEFVRALAQDVHASVAARSAALVVIALRDPGTAWTERHGDTQSEVAASKRMLFAMWGGGK